MDLLVPTTDSKRWRDLADDLGVTVAMVWGSDDRIGDRS